MKRLWVLILAVLMLMSWFSVAYAQNWAAEHEKEFQKHLENEREIKLLPTSEWGSSSEDKIMKEWDRFKEVVKILWKKYIGKIRIGMTDKQVFKLTGEPIKINRIVGRWGVHQQWIIDGYPFGTMYLYFENGILSSWQY